jgi:hypothetical protein
LHATTSVTRLNYCKVRKLPNNEACHLNPVFFSDLKESTSFTSAFYKTFTHLLKSFDRNDKCHSPLPLHLLLFLLHHLYNTVQCGHQSSLRCSRCLGALYCSVKCQRKDWKTHKVMCKRAEDTKKSLEAQGYRTVEEIDAELDEYRRFAELGDSRAQFNVGLSYFTGVGVGVDKAEGVKWFRLAAEQGHAGSQFNLGNAYDDGDGVSIDKVEAVKWYRLAAEQGDAQAQFSLGVSYANGDGVSVDIVEAIQWFRLAAAQGYADAQYSLGVSCYHGDGVTVDKVESVKWFRLASAQGLADAQFNLGCVHCNGEGVSVDKVEGLKWMKLAAENGYPIAIKLLESYLE